MECCTKSSDVSKFVLELLFCQFLLSGISHILELYELSLLENKIKF